MRALTGHLVMNKTAYYIKISDRNRVEKSLLDPKRFG